ncbi:MAG: cytochrome c oxidase subunit 3 [Chthoniobacterales bacterium]
MTTAELTHDEVHQGATPSTARFGMIMFLLSEAMLFAALLITYTVLRIGHPGDWPPHGAPDLRVRFPLTMMNYVMIINSFILISSSFTFHWVEVQIKKHGKSGLFPLLVTIALGTVFLCVQGWEWSHLYEEGMWFSKEMYGIYGSCFFVTTGFHGMHVFVGLLLLIWCFLRQVCFGSFTQKHHVALDNVGLYWHFVDGVWLVVYTLFYII